MVVILRLSGDEGARVPFAMLGVIIIMMSIFSTTYIQGVHHQAAGNMVANAELERQKSVLREAEEIMATEGYLIASQSIMSSTQFLCNQSLLDVIFQENYSEYIESRFPYYMEPYRVEVRDFSASIYLDDMGLKDLEPSNETIGSNITATDGQGNSVSSTVETQDTVTGQCLENTTELARYIITGQGNCTVRNTLNGGAMECPLEFQREIDSPFPMMNSRMEKLEAQCQSDIMGVSRTMKYILTTIAQFRVLQGYGSGLDSAPGGTGEIISNADISLALNLALVLESARLFRDYDESVLPPEIRGMLEDYIANATLDPMDIIALYQNLDTEQIPVDFMLAQAMNAIADQFVLKYLDYLGITDITNSIYRTGQKLGDWVSDMGDSLSQFIFGGENRDGATQVCDWIEGLDLNWPPEETGQPGIIAGTGTETSLGTLDIVQPVSQGFKYNSTCTRLVSQELEPVFDSDGLEIGTRHDMVLEWYNLSTQTRSSSSAGVQGYLVDFRPVSILSGNEALWQQFYEDFYAQQEDIIYNTVRDAVKNMTLELARIISRFIDQQDLTLSSFSNGQYSIDPNDRDSIMKSLGNIIEDVMNQTIQHLQGDQSALELLLSALSSRQGEMILELTEFIFHNYDQVVGMEECRDSGLSSMALSMLWNSTMVSELNHTETVNYVDYNELGESRGFVDQEAATYDCTDLPDPVNTALAVYADNSNELYSDLLPFLDQAYGKLRDAESQWYYSGSPENGLYIQALESSAICLENNGMEMFVGQGDDSFIGTAAAMVGNVLEEITLSGDMANVQYCPMMPYEGNVDGFFLLRESPESEPWQESFTVHQLINELDIAVSEPWGTHYTDAANFSKCPFETSWAVNVTGLMRIICTGSSTPYLGNQSLEPASIDREIDIDLGIVIVAYSGWGLESVDYEITASLAQDIGKAMDAVMDFLGWVWDTIAAPINWLIDQIMKVVEFFQDIIGTLLGYASDIMNIITGIIGKVVETAQEFLRDIASWIFEGIVGWILDNVPEELCFGFSMFGFDFNVSFPGKDAFESAINGQGASIMRIETKGNVFGSNMNLGLDFCILPDDIADMADIDYDLLLSSQIHMKGFVLDTSIDPFMATQEHLVECHGQGAGWGLDMVMPEIESYDSVQYSLHDIPGVGAALSNIPIPPLGVKASINAGLEILYTLRGLEAEHVCINEVELNPRGIAEGKQWVELYNPTDITVELDDWNLSETNSNTTYVFSDGAVIEPGGYFIACFQNQLPLEDSSFSLAEPRGAVIDSEGPFSDSGIGSAKSWQRSPNGANFTMAGEWTFNQSTPNEENMGIDLDFKQVAWNLIKGAFNSTWQDLKDQLELSLDFIVQLITQFIQRFIEDVLRIIEKSVVETSLFIDVMLTDMTGSGGGGITLSFVIEGGRTLAQILRWIIGSVATFLNNFGSPSQPSQYPKLAEDVPEHLFLRLEFYGMVQVPQMLKKAAMEEEDMDPVKLAGRIEANIPALGALCGREMGRWRINFGVYVEEMPANIADPLFGTGDASPDVWLFKGAVYEG